MSDSQVERASLIAVAAVELPRGLLDPLTTEQQALVEVVGHAFLDDPGKWPYFEYVERALDKADLDAAGILATFPRVGYYEAVWCPRSGRPNRDNEVGLTVVGMFHCNALRDRFPRDLTIPQIDISAAFLELLPILVEKYESAPLTPHELQNVEVNSRDVISELHNRGYHFDRLPEPLIFGILDHEPPYIRNGASLHTEGTWTVGLDRGIRAFRGVGSIADYVARLEEFQSKPAPLPLAAPSPLDLVAALDYFDTVWRLAHDGKRLLHPESLERAAKLAYPANTADEFESKVSALGELLRGARDSVPVTRARKVREHPLGWLEAHLVRKLGDESRARVQTSVRTLERVLAVRDAREHGAAQHRAVTALAQLGIAYPIVNWSSAWATIQAQVIEAVGALREELQTSASRASD